MAPTSRPAEVIEALTELAPCPIIHSVNELPKVNPWYGKPSRSRYYPARKDEEGIYRDFILINEGPARHWLYVDVLAHEVGHALDRHGLHPAQHLLHSPRGRYRNELAAVSFEIAVCCQGGLNRLKQGNRWLVLSTVYLEQYARGPHPTLQTVMRAMPEKPLVLQAVQERQRRRGAALPKTAQSYRAQGV